MRRFLIATVMAATALVFGTAYGEVKEDIHLHKSCKICGMDRELFDYSRMLIEYDDGSVAAFCSTRCAALDFAYNVDKTPKVIRVGDYATKELIDAERAFWVVGGSKPGVMSGRAKWAFGKRAEAEAYVKANGGNIVSFESAMKAAYEDMYADTKMIRDKRKAKKAQPAMHEHKH